MRSHVPGGRAARRCALLGTLVFAAACVDPTSPTLGRTFPTQELGVNSSAGVIDFTTYGSGKAFEPNFYQASDGVLFSRRQCGYLGCRPWPGFVGFIQSDEALVGNSGYGPIQATFSTPINSLFIRVAPAFVGTAVYVLAAFSASGARLSKTSLKVTQDSGDPDHSGFGYFTIGLTNLPQSAVIFKLTNEFIRSSSPQITGGEYGVASISYVTW